MTELNIGFSPCPNDTFIFHALLHDCIDTDGFRFVPHIEDVDELNKKAYLREYEITKLSVYAYMLLKDRYEILDSGAALGFGCGPMLVARRDLKSLHNARIAVPGRHTTAFLLFQLWMKECRSIEVVRFDRILPGIAEGVYDAGLIIHEGRFIYPDFGCSLIIDLGQWWEDLTGLPIPLGCIAIRKDIPAYRQTIESIIHDSVKFAGENPGVSKGFIRAHAQELDEKVIADHISLYVNEFTLSLGEKGARAIDRLEEMARCQNLI